MSARERDSKTAATPDPEQVERHARDYELRHLGYEAFRERQARRSWIEPEYEASLADELKLPDEKQPFTIDELHVAGGNSLFVAQFKTGKTTMAMNLAASLADQEPFLDHFAVAEIAGRIGYWDNELTPSMFRRWARDMEIRHPENIVALHWKAQPSRPDLSTKFGQDWTVKWLKKNRIAYWIVDPVAALITPFGAETSNDDITRLTDGFDRIKALSGVPDMTLSIHTGRQQMEEGQERSRGATRFEDWMDAGWYLTKEDDVRYLRAIGRDVDLKAITLEYNQRTRRYVHSGRTRVEHRGNRLAEAFVEALAGMDDETPTGDVTKTLSMSKADQSKAVAAAEKEGYITREKVGQTKLCTLTKKGRDLAKRRFTLPDSPLVPDSPSVLPEGRQTRKASRTPSSPRRGEERDGVESKSVVRRRGSTPSRKRPAK